MKWLQKFMLRFYGHEILAINIMPSHSNENSNFLMGMREKDVM
jgi:hypothetical protein